MSKVKKGDTPIEGWDGIFADPEVGRVLYANGLIANANKSSIEELATITTFNPTNGYIGSYFYNTKITQFPELQYCTGLTDLYYAFRSCSSLVEAPIIPSIVNELYNTFRDCSSLLEAPVIPEGVTTLYGAFNGCSSLTTAPIIPEGVTDMNSTFIYCSSLTTAPDIPSSVTDLTLTFQECTNLTTVGERIPEGITNLTQTFSGCSSLTTTPVIPESVTNMRATFYGCSSLTTAPLIPEGVTNLGITFSGCSSLTTAPDIPSSVTELVQTFYRCSNIDGIYIINIVTPPYYSASLSNTQAIYVPDESVQLYKEASGWSNFADKIHPMSEYWDGIFADPEVGRVLHANGLIADANKSSIEELATITSLNPEGAWGGSYFYNNKVITQFPELQYCTGLTDLFATFNGCSSLTTVGDIIPNGVTNLGNIFYGCTNLTTAPAIPEGVNSLYSAFRDCSSLLEAPVIPSSVTSLFRTFYNCSSIDGIYIINAATPISYNRTLSNVQAIYVPDESVSAYKTASGWSDFADKIHPMSSKP